jgi:hypothetical protein
MANKMHPLGAPRASYTWSASAREVDMATSVAKPVHLLIDANFLGYGCVMVEDCCATTSPDFCTEASVWNVKKCFGFVTDSGKILKALKK